MSSVFGGRWWRRRPATGAAPESAPLVGRDEAADIDARLAAVLADWGDHRTSLAIRLQPLVERQVPARCIEAAPHHRATRIRFADGTTVLARGTAPGQVAVLAAEIRLRSLPPAACTTDEEGTYLLFGWPGRRRTLSILVTGMDQPD
jgi:hypothetical protein